MLSTRYCQIQINLEIFCKDFREILKYKISSHPSSGSRIVSCAQSDGRTDRYDEASGRFSHIANAPQQYMFSND